MDEKMNSKIHPQTVIDAYSDFFKSVLKEADKKDPATLECIARLAEGFKAIRNW